MLQFGHKMRKYTPPFKSMTVHAQIDTANNTSTGGKMSNRTKIDRSYGLILIKWMNTILGTITD